MRGAQFDQLTAFVAVAENGSFTKAARRLGMVTPSVSHAIRSLEEKFGVRLLNRNTRSVSLTDAGEQLLNQLKPIMDDINKAIESIAKFRNSPTGTLRLSVHPLAAVTVIGPMVARFAMDFPDISLEISIDPDDKDIVSERFDAGIQPSFSIAQHMIAVPIGRPFELSTVASPQYLARRGQPSTPGDLVSHNCIRYSWKSDLGRKAWTFQRAGQRTNVAIVGSLAVNDLSLALRAGLDGLGVVQLPKMWIEPYLVEGKLVKILADWSLQLVDFRLFYSSRRHVSTKLRVLADFLRKASRDAAHINDKGQHCSCVVDKSGIVPAINEKVAA
jgi:DNA-binding transcriptional LysR family regulator